MSARDEEAEAHRRDYARKRACGEAADALRAAEGHFAETDRVRRQIREMVGALEEEQAHIVRTWD